MEACDGLSGAIGRGVIHDDDPPILIIAYPSQAVQTLERDVFAVKNRDDDADARHNGEELIARQRKQRAC